MKHKLCSLEESLYIWKLFWTAFSQLGSDKLPPYMQQVSPSWFRPVMAKLSIWSFRTTFHISLSGQVSHNHQCSTTAAVKPSASAQLHIPRPRKATTDWCPLWCSQALTPPSCLLRFLIICCSPAHTQNTAAQQHLQSQMPLSYVYYIFISFPPQAGEHCTSLYTLIVYFIMLSTHFPNPHHKLTIIPTGSTTKN